MLDAEPVADLNGPIGMIDDTHGPISVSSASRTTSLSGARYRAGYVSQLELLDAQRSELRNRRQELQVRSDRFQSTVALVRALGGGWE